MIATIKIVGALAAGISAESGIGREMCEPLHTPRL
jgi:hypothetical protein